MADSLCLSKVKYIRRKMMSEELKEEILGLIKDLVHDPDVPIRIKAEHLLEIIQACNENLHLQINHPEGDVK